MNKAVNAKAQTKPVKKKKPASLDAKKARAGWFFVLPFVIGFVILYIPMLISSVEFSFSKIHVLGKAGYALEYIGFENYRFLEGDYENLSGAFYVRDSVLFSEIYHDFVKNKETGKKVTLALQSIPLGPDRQAVGIYYKEVDGTETSAELAADWEGPYRVSEKPSAYSTMIQLKNRKIAFYFEEYDRIRTLDYHMVYTELSMSEITSGKYVARK